MIKIVHYSDLHVRNLKFHKEYRTVLNNFNAKLEEIKPDILVFTGDFAHTKTQISPEFVEMAHEHLRDVSLRVPRVDLILGNHDFNMMNRDRQDALTPVVESMKLDNVFLHKNSGLVSIPEHNLNFWVFSLADDENYPNAQSYVDHENEINIGLFHGSVINCVTDSNWRMTHVEYDLDIFDGLDYAFLGDIHKQQFFRDGRIAYAGSLIQQNFGEELNKGFLFWEIESKEKFQVTPHMLQGSKKYYTFKLSEDFSLNETDVEEGSRIRIIPPFPITLVQQKEIEKLVKKKYKPHDVMTLSYTNIGTHAEVEKSQINVENLRQIDVQEKLIRDFLADRKLDEKIYEKIFELNKKYQVHVEQKDDVIRNVQWKLDKIAWSNMFNYGEGNVIDFSQLGGLTGLFAPNASGKSNVIDIILETCFDATTKGINKNIFLINDNKDMASSIAEVSTSDQNYVIERSIERIKYGQRKYDEMKEWGKTSVNFYAVDEDGTREPLMDTLRPGTERNIRQRLGTFDDFMLTSLSAQWNPTDIISVKETKRKEILYKFLDLDLFEQKCMLAKDESKEYVKKLYELEEGGYEEILKKHQAEISNIKARFAEKKSEIDVLIQNSEDLEEEILSLTGQKVKIGITVDQSAAALKIKRAESELTIQSQKIDENQKKLEDIEAEIAKLRILEKKFDVTLHEKKSLELDEVEDELADLEYSLKRNDDSLAENTKNASILKDVPCGNSFPKCKFLVNAFECKKKIAELNENSVTLREKIDALKASISSLKKFKDKHELYKKFMGDKAGLESRRDNVKLQMENSRLRIDSFNSDKDAALRDLVAYAKAEEDIKKNRELDERIQELKRIKSMNSEMVKSYEDETSDLNRELGSEQMIVKRLTEQLSLLKETRDTCNAYEHYISAMGKDGIAYKILTQKLPLINEEINKILLNAADFGVFIEHDPIEQSIRIFLQYGQYKSRLLELGSGSEKFLASIAIRSALLNISNLPKTNMFIVDEGFGKLDPKNLESIGRMFDYLKSIYEHVIVISHVDTMKDLADNIIEITTDEEGYAHLEVGG